MATRKVTTPSIFFALMIATGAAHAQVQYNPFGNSSNSIQLYGPDGHYLGNLNSNQFDPNSISNPFSPHGNSFGRDSIYNPFTYGSPFGPPTGSFGQ